jgi:hypothetical protein
MQHQADAALGRRCTECTVRRSRQRAGRGSAFGLTLSLLAALLGACDGNDRRATNGGAKAAASSEAHAGATAGDMRRAPAGMKPICPATGQWQLCSVLERLDRAGLAPRQDSGRVTEAPLSSPGVALQLGRSELRVFIYADRAARERDQAKLDRTKYVDANQTVSMKVEPTLITTENLLAILRSRSDQQRERVSDALTAGPPQKPQTED